MLRCLIMHVERRALALIASVAVLTGCGSSKNVAAPQGETAQTARPARPVTLDDVKKTQDAQAQELARVAGEVKAIDAQQAFLVAELKSITEQLAKLKTSVDDARSAVEDMRRATPVTPAPAPSATPAPAPAPAATPAPAPAPAPAAAPSPAPPRAPLPPPGPRGGGAGAAVPARNPDADRMFSAALAKLRAGEGGQAALEFTEFVTQFPNHPQAAAAQNWIGEAYYRQRDYRQATAEFQKTVDHYTQTAEVAEALLKIGLCRRALGDAAAARAAWEQLVKQYPKSEAAAQARGFLAGRSNGGSRTR
jgi:tol-pal system protein YbgF